MSKPIVIIESPFAGDVERNVAYAQAAMRDCLLRGEAPYASHLLYTQPGVLDDSLAWERDLGIQAGFSFRALAQKTVVYRDLGMSRGMELGVEHARRAGHTIEYRSLKGWGPNDVPRVDLPGDGCDR
jgi:hypothetical protein